MHLSDIIGDIEKKEGKGVIKHGKLVEKGDEVELSGEVFEGFK